MGFNKVIVSFRNNGSEQTPVTELTAGHYSILQSRYKGTSAQLAYMMQQGYKGLVYTTCNDGGSMPIVDANDFINAYEHYWKY